jgi:leucyl-tRNA synthetase
MQAMGLAIDWSREVATCDPSYYKWNQWLFLKMLEKGIAYRKTQVVNWDPVDQTVLANEQVIDGKGWRTGAVVEKREIPGYYLKITDYADELLDSAAQAARLARARQADAGKLDRQERRRALCLHARHPGRLRQADRRRKDVRLHHARRHHHGRDLLRRGARAPAGRARRVSNPKLAAFIEECKAGGTTEAELATQEKKGVPTGSSSRTRSPASKVEVWVGNYVLMSYGDGAVMGVPAHDERDFEFAKKYKLPIKQVVDVEGPAYRLDAWADWYGDKQRGVTINSGKYDGFLQGRRDAVAPTWPPRAWARRKPPGACATGA